VTSDKAILTRLNELIGREHVVFGVDEVSRNDIRRKLEVFCFDCPLHLDDATAAAHGFRMAPAPSAMIPLWAMPAYWTRGEPDLYGPGKPESDGGMQEVLPVVYSSGVNAGSEVEYFEPVYPGDRLRSVVKLVDVKPRQTRLGKGVFLTVETAVSKLGGERVAVRRNTSYRYNADPDRKTDTAEAKTGAGNETPRQEPGRPDCGAGNEPIDWSRQLRYSELAPGQELPGYFLWLSYQRIVMSVAVDRMFSGIHHNRDYATSVGLADIIFNTRGYEMALEVTIRRWMGFGGRLVKFGPFKMVSNSHPGDTLVFGGRIAGMEIVDGERRVSLDVWADSPRRRAAEGAAVVVLPD